mmetsp:Transcript_22321/g.53086  ORF Transcript_22321/g.53086 Transcript_22321/m.53086 type:complete len:483 (+) Transcript_22321:160-1608(+)
MKSFNALLVILAQTAVVNAQQVVLKFRNESDDYLSSHWVHPQTGKTTLIKGDIEPRSLFTLNSHLGHEFEIWQEPDPVTGFCGSGEDKECDKIGHFTVTEEPEQAFIITEGVKVEAVKASVPPQSKKDKKLINIIDLNTVSDPIRTLRDCKERARNELNELADDMIVHNDYDEASLTKQIHDKLHDCVTVGLAPRLKASDDEVEFERELRLQSANIAENFTCVNTDLESSPDISTDEWTSEIDGVKRTVHKKLERPASRIHVVENFASPEECKAMEDEAAKRLHVASTADGKGGSRISAARKAMQAGINPQFTSDGKPVDDNLISFLSGRVYEYTNYVLDLNITHHGQEPLMSIQYNGRGRHDIEPDRYTPHCDGRCNGEPHQFGGRMATMVIYCTIPTQGGFTNFQNSNVHVRPDSGSAVFFSYFDPLTNITDNGLTQHSGCPVYEGEKKIITQWVRYGVSSETPHTAFNTLTILRSEDGE